MASFGHTFDASSIEPSTAYEVLPPGKYLAQIVASEMRVTKDGQGQYLYLEIDVLDGQYAGRKLFDRLNLVNANPDVVEIAQRTLSSICRAVGKLQVTDSNQLHLIPFIADVRVRPPKGEYGETNSIRYLPRTPRRPSQPRAERFRLPCCRYTPAPRRRPRTACPGSGRSERRCQRMHDQSNRPDTLRLPELPAGVPGAPGRPAG